MLRSWLRAFFVLIVAAGAVRGAHAQSEDDLLPVEQAFKLTAKIAEPSARSRVLDIAPDYYLYLRAHQGEDVAGGHHARRAPALPGEENDEFLGEVEVYHQSPDAKLPTRSRMRPRRRSRSRSRCRAATRSIRRPAIRRTRRR